MQNKIHIAASADKKIYRVCSLAGCVSPQSVIQIK